MRSMHNHPDVTANTNRPKIKVFCFVELMKLHSWICGIQLEIKGSGFDSLLLFVIQLCEAIGECVGNA